MRRKAPTDESPNSNDAYTDEFAQAAAGDDFKRAKELGIKWALLSSDDAKDSANRSAALVNILKVINMKAENRDDDDKGLKGFLKKKRLTREEAAAAGIPVPASPTEGSVFVTRTLAKSDELAPRGEKVLEFVADDDEPEAPAIEDGAAPASVVSPIDILTTYAQKDPEDMAATRRYLDLRREGKTHPVAFTLSKARRVFNRMCQEAWDARVAEGRQHE